MTTLHCPNTISVLPPSNILSKSASIYQYTHIAVSALIMAFDDAKAKRGKPRGVLTDQEQDILRAALVMSCAGVDAVLKQTIRDTIEPLLEKDQSVRDGFERFIHKRINGESDAIELYSGAKFLASVLADREPRRRLIEDYIKDLTGDSLQSAEEILRTAAALGVDNKVVKIDIPRLKEIFTIRNKIIHELDIDLSAYARKRRVRSQADLLDSADTVLDTVRRVVEAVGTRL
ncbi:MAG: HEPN domain-containing protein [Pseudomonadota bacterium]|jgi:hypothetical protein|nr:HEPN domain-containing protein [Pseudomonadota bacterium]